MKNVLIICDNIHEINRLRGFFGLDFKVRATNTIENALAQIQSAAPDLALYSAGADLRHLFSFYTSVRKNPATKAMQLIVTADAAILKSLTDTVEMTNTSVISSAITSDNMRKLVDSLAAPKM